VHFAEIPEPGQIRSVTELPVGPLLRTGLENAAVAADRIAYGLAFSDGYTKRFLAVHVFAGPRRSHGDRGVPMVLRAYHHGINVITSQNLAEIVVGVTGLAAAAPVRLILLGNHLRCAITLVAFDIAYGHYLCVGRWQKRTHVARAAPTGTDDPQRDAIRRWCCIVASQRRGWHNPWRRHRRRRMTDKTSPRDPTVLSMCSHRFAPLTRT